MQKHITQYHIVKPEQLERLRSEETTAAPWLPILFSHRRSQVKRRQSQSYKFKEFAKISSIVEDTERTRLYPQTDR